MKCRPFWLRERLGSVCWLSRSLHSDSGTAFGQGCFEKAYDDLALRVTFCGPPAVSSTHTLWCFRPESLLAQDHMCRYLVVHGCHAVVATKRGRLIMRRDPQQLKAFVRSALKPFQPSMVLSSGAADQRSVYSGLAIACFLLITGTRPGSAKPSRFSGVPIWRLNAAVPQPRPGAAPEHNCSGKPCRLFSAPAGG